jgi:hypothetical protein
MKRLHLIVFLTLVFLAPLVAQQQSQRVDQLETRVSSLEQKVLSLGDEALVLTLFGAFCALWAQNTGRNSLLWFFLGMFFSVIAVLVLLSKNSDDIDRRGSGRHPPSEKMA